MYVSCTVGGFPQFLQLNAPKSPQIWTLQLDTSKNREERP